MRIKTEDELLKLEIRKQIIEEIKGPENVLRKNEHYKRQMLFKDKTDLFVVEQLKKQFDESTVKEMSFAICNISIVKKVINKLATVYNNGVKRIVPSDQDATEKVELMAKDLELNQKQKTANKLLKLHKNCDVYVKPMPKGENNWSVSIQPLAPYLYDVVENYYDRTKPLAYVLSYFKPQDTLSADSSKHSGSLDKKGLGDGKDQLIADSPQDDNSDKQEFIWWSDKYHFTTDEKGIVISETTNNPILEKPFVSYAIDQDNSFWSDGGDDLCDSATSINTQIAHQNYIGVIQGYGQAYFKGKNPPRNLAVGPNKVILMEYESDDPVPDFGFVSSNPPLQALQASTEMQLALLLTTNNLSTKSISTTMSSGGDFPSAIAMVIDQAESTEDANEQREVFYSGDVDTLLISNKWLHYFAMNNELSKEDSELLFPEDSEIVVQFNDPRSILSERERLENIEKRKSLGLNTREELLMLDQPALTEEQAKEKLDLISKQRQSQLKSTVTPTDKGLDENSQDNNNVESNVEPT